MTRNRSREDERVVRVRLTDKGWAMREKVKEIPWAVGECVSLPREEAFQLYSLLNRLLGAEG